MSKRLIMVDANAFDDAAERVLRDVNESTTTIQDRETRALIMHMNLLIISMLRIQLFGNDTKQY